jgi:hypothetical protein
MPRATKTEGALAIALAPAGGGAARVLWIAMPRPPGWAPAQSVLEDQLDALPEGPFDAAVVGPTRHGWVSTLRAARARIRPEGVLVAIAPIEQTGVRSLAQRTLAVMDARRAPRPLEEVCAAALSAGASPVGVLALSGIRGNVVVHGVVR